MDTWGSGGQIGGLNRPFDFSNRRPAFDPEGAHGGLHVLNARNGMDSGRMGKRVLVKHATRSGTAPRSAFGVSIEPGDSPSFASRLRVSL